MVSWIKFFVPMAFLTALPVHCAEIPLNKGELAIPPGGSRELEFGTVPQHNTTVLLEISARLHTKTYSGSSYFMKIKLNGHEVKAARSRGAIRLVNRPLVAPVAAGALASWCGGGVWRLIYAPDFKLNYKNTCYTSDPYVFTLDVTDLTNPAAENRLILSNIANRGAGNIPPDEGDLVIQRLVVRTESRPSPMMMTTADVQPVINRGQPGAGPAKYRGEILPGGGFRITVGQRQWNFSSDFSYPNAGLNRLLPTESSPNKEKTAWSMQTRSSDQGGEVVAEAADYRLRRTVRFTPRKIEIADAITNVHSDSPLGLLVRHEVDLAGVASPVVRLAGNPDPSVDDYWSAMNPTVHISLPDQGVGLVCEDDVFRNQARLFWGERPSRAGFRTEMFRLSPGETYTLRWSVYPVAGQDYFDFINLVREDWGSNVTADGAWMFFDPDTTLSMSLDTIRTQFERQGIRYAVYCGGWIDRKHDPKRIGFGTGVLDDYWADFRRRLRDAGRRIREAVPHVKVLVYYDAQRDTSEGGHERFRDSWLTGAGGTQLSTDWSGLASLTYSVVATTQNSFGRAMLVAADRYMKELQCNGLYWDEMEGVEYGSPLITYNQFDGHSCQLHPEKYTIEREVGITSLLGESHRLAVIDRVRRQGGDLMANGPPTTHAILATGIPKMVEMIHNDYWCYEGNLGTPLGYIGDRMDFGGIIRFVRLAVLPIGTRADYPHEISRFLFPFTPIELHSGYLLGKERIVTIHDGNYGWPGEQCLVQLHHFNREGKRNSSELSTLIGAEARTSVKLSDGEAFILERLPVVVKPSAGQAQVTNVNYSADGLELRLNAPQGATLRIDEGRFSLQQSGAFMARIGQDPQQPVLLTNGSLQVDVKPGSDLQIRVSHKK